jgi:hypothetical protein
MDTDKIYKTIFFFILMSLVSKVYALDLKALNDSIANFKDYRVSLYSDQMVHLYNGENNIFLNKDGKEVISTNLPIFDFYKNLNIVGVIKNNKIGFLDKNGEWLSPPVFDYDSALENILVEEKIKDSLYVFNIFDKQSSLISSTYEGQREYFQRIGVFITYPVQDGFIFHNIMTNKSEKYDSFYPYSNNYRPYETLISVRKGEKCGVISSQTGNLLYPYTTIPNPNSHFVLYQNHVLCQSFGSDEKEILNKKGEIVCSGKKIDFWEYKNYIVAWEESKERKNTFRIFKNAKETDIFKYSSNKISIEDSALIFNSNQRSLVIEDFYPHSNFLFVTKNGHKYVISKKGEMLDGSKYQDITISPNLILAHKGDNLFDIYDFNFSVIKANLSMVMPYNYPYNLADVFVFSDEKLEPWWESKTVRRFYIWDDKSAKMSSIMGLGVVDCNGLLLLYLDENKNYKTYQID